MNIVLTGFMGTGKSVTGRWLGKELGLPFLDTDDLIEEKVSMKIPEIFEKHGEPYFRKVETEVIRDVVSSSNDIVLASGGGAVLNEENYRLLSQWGTIVRLRASVDCIYKRVRTKFTRPLLADSTDLRSDIEKILNDREPFYDKAQFTVDTDDREIKEVTEEIIELLNSGDYGS